MKTRYAKERRRRKQVAKTRRKVQERRRLIEQVQDELHVSFTALDASQLDAKAKAG